MALFYLATLYNSHGSRGRSLFNIQPCIIIQYIWHLLHASVAAISGHIYRPFCVSIGFVVHRNIGWFRYYNATRRQYSMSAGDPIDAVCMVIGDWQPSPNDRAVKMLHELDRCIFTQYGNSSLFDDVDCSTPVQRIDAVNVRKNKKKTSKNAFLWEKTQKRL